MYMLPTLARDLGPLRTAASLLSTHVRRTIVISFGLALIALAAAASPAAASDPTNTLAEATLIEEVTASVELSPTAEPEPPQVPVVGERPVDPTGSTQTLLAAIIELVADPPPVPALPDAGIVAPPSLGGLSVPSINPDTEELDATAQVTELVASARPTTPQLLEPVENPDGPAGVKLGPSTRLAIDGRDGPSRGGEPVQADIAPRSVVGSTFIVRLATSDHGWHVTGTVAPIAVPRIASGSVGFDGSSSTTDLYPVAAMLATLAAAGGGWLILRLRAPPIPGGIWLAAPVPPG